jgi:iron(III) transport system ATP-binding protein
VSDAPPPDIPRNSSRTVLKVTAITKVFVRNDRSRVIAADGITFELNAGEFLVLLGPSGCGKTTLLRAIAGLERPDGGDIVIDETLVYSRRLKVNLPTERRPISMVFQSYALWPHMTAIDNVAFPLRTRRVRKREARQKALEALRIVGLADIAEQHPAQLSGGQQQRVSLARALVRGSRIILFDEPLSNVDARVRAELRVELAELQRELGFAAVYVTHDQTEALALAHRIAVMDHGAIVQLDSPQRIYDSPKSIYVAEFVGGANVLSGEVVSSAGDRVTVRTPIGVIKGVMDGGAAPGSPVSVAFRPEACIVGSRLPGDEETNTVSGRVKVSLFAGSRTELIVDVDGVDMAVSVSSRVQAREGEALTVLISPGDVRVFARDEVAAS